MFGFGVASRQQSKLPSNYRWGKASDLMLELMVCQYQDFGMDPINGCTGTMDLDHMADVIQSMGFRYFLFAQNPATYSAYGKERNRQMAWKLVNRGIKVAYSPFGQGGVDIIMPLDKTWPKPFAVRCGTENWWQMAAATDYGGTYKNLEFPADGTTVVAGEIWGFYDTGNNKQPWRALQNHQVNTASAVGTGYNSTSLRMTGSNAYWEANWLYIARRVSADVKARLAALGWSDVPVVSVSIIPDANGLSNPYDANLDICSAHYYSWGVSNGWGDFVNLRVGGGRQLNEWHMNFNPPNTRTGRMWIGEGGWSHGDDMQAHNTGKEAARYTPEWAFDTFSRGQIEKWMPYNFSDSLSAPGVSCDINAGSAAELQFGYTKRDPNNPSRLTLKPVGQTLKNIADVCRDVGQTHGGRWFVADISGSTANVIYKFLSKKNGTNMIAMWLQVEVVASAPSTIAPNRVVSNTHWEQSVYKGSVIPADGTPVKAGWTYNAGPSGSYCYVVRRDHNVTSATKPTALTTDFQNADWEGGNIGAIQKAWPAWTGGPRGVDIDPTPQIVTWTFDRAYTFIRSTNLVTGVVSTLAVNASSVNVSLGGDPVVLELIP